MDYFALAAALARAQVAPLPDRLCPTCAHVTWHRSTSPMGVQEFRCAQDHLLLVAPAQERG